jgi:hypothetical protein
MGRSVTPAYRVEVVDQAGYKWQTEFKGQATLEGLTSWARAFNNSVVNGHNSHLGPEGQVAHAKVVSQKGARRGETIVEASF